MREEDGFGLVVRERERRRISPRKWPQMMGEIQTAERFAGKSGWIGTQRGGVLDIFFEIQKSVHFIASRIAEFEKMKPCSANQRYSIEKWVPSR